MDFPLVHPSDSRMSELIDSMKEQVFAADFPLKIRTDTDFLAKFLRSRKYNVEKAVKAVQKYYINLYSNIRLVDGVFPTNYIDVYKLNAFRLLRNSHNGARIVHAKAKNWDTKVASLRDLEIAATFILEEIFLEPKVQVAGGIAIVDLSGFSFNHVRQFTYSELKLAMKVGTEMFPLRVASIHILNAPAIFLPIYKLALKLLPKKIQERNYIHANLEELTNSLPPTILPKSLGGILEENEAYDLDFISNVLQRNRPYDWYWSGALERAYQPRRLSRKRSSMSMS